MHECKRCSKPTDNYFLCNDCIDIEAGDSEIDYKAYSEKMDMLYEKELDAYYAAHGY